MPIFFILLIFIMMLVLAFAFKGKSAPVNVRNMEYPTTERGAVIGVLFGKRMIPDLHLIWHGDLRVLKHNIKPENTGKK